MTSGCEENGQLKHFPSKHLQRLTMKTLHTQYTLNPQPNASQTLPLKLLPSSRISFLFFIESTSRIICTSIASIALTSTCKLLRCAAAGELLVIRLKNDCDAADEASRAADASASESDLVRCCRSRRVRYKDRSAARIWASVTASLQEQKTPVSCETDD